MNSRTGFGLGIGVAALVLAAAATARADVEAMVSAAPASIAVGTTQRVSYTLTVRNTAPTEARFAFVAPATAFAPDEGAALVPDPAGLTVAGMALAGPGSASIGQLPECAHGLAQEEYAWDVVLARGGTGTLTLPYTVSDRPRWPQTSYRPLFALASHLAGGGPGTLTSDVHVRAPDPRVTGRRGVRITLATTPGSTRRRDGEIEIDRGDAVRVRGRTSPVLKGTRVSVVVQARRQRRVVRTRTDEHGRFAIDDLAFTRRGTTLVSARYTSTGSGIASDAACPVTFDVG